jgi:hypothetical protein
VYCHLRRLILSKIHSIINIVACLHVVHIASVFSYVNNNAVLDKYSTQMNLFYVFDGAIYEEMEVLQMRIFFITSRFIVQLATDVCYRFLSR